MHFFSNNSVYLSFLATYTTPTTQKTVKNVSRLFLLHFFNNNPKKLEHINATHVQQFIKDKLNTVTFSTANQYLRVIKRLCHFLYRQKIINLGVYEDVTNIKKIKGTRPPAGRALKPSEVKKVKNDYSPSNKTIDIRDYAIFALAAYTGIRRCEISKINIRDISSKKINIIGKGNKYRPVYLSAQAHDALRNWLKHSEINTGSLFRGVDRWGNVKKNRLGVDGVSYAIGRIKDKSNTAHFTSHDLRRTFATSLLDKNADVLTVQALMGHASIDTTRIYDRRPERAKKKAIELLPY